MHLSGEHKSRALIQPYSAPFDSKRKSVSAVLIIAIAIAIIIIRFTSTKSGEHIFAAIFFHFVKLKSFGAKTLNLSHPGC